MDKSNNPKEKAQKDGKTSQPRKKSGKEGLKSTIEGLDMFTFEQGRMTSGLYVTARQKVINYVGINLHRVLSVVEYEAYEEPVAPEEPEPAEGELEITQFQRDRYNREYSEYLRRVEEYEAHSRRLYSVLWTICSLAMRHKIQEDPQFSVYSRAKDPLLLWKEIKRLCLEDQQAGASVQVSARRVEEARRSFQRLYQHEDELIGDFYERFLIESRAVQVAGVSFGTKSDTDIALERLQEERATFDPDGVLIDFTEEENDEMAEIARKESAEKELALIFANKLNRKIYGSMIREWENALNNGQNIYPKTVSETYRRANNRRPEMDKRLPNIHNGVAFHTKESKNDQGSKGKVKDIKCYFCELKGHKKPDCPLWKKATKLLLKDKKASNDDEECNVCVGEVESIDYSIPDMVFKISAEDRRHLILNDNQATISIMHDKNLLDDIRPASKPLIVKGIGNGVLRCDMVGNFGDFKSPVYYHPDASANILCFADLQKQYRITYDNGTADAFYCHTEKGIAEFKPYGKLYAYQPNRENVFITTVAEQRANYTQEQLKKADLAHDLFIKLQRPSLEDFKQLIREGRLIDSPITVQDIDRWIEIEGPDLGSIKGRTVRIRPDAVVPINKPHHEHKFVAIAADIFYIDSLPFLLGMELESKLLVVHYLKNRLNKSIIDGFKCFKSTLAEFSLTLDTVLIDGEGAASSFKIDLSSMGITINNSSKGEHVPSVERAIRQIKERVRATINTLPYQLPSVAILYLTFSCVSAINLFPRESRIESPREIVTGRRLSYKADCRLQFGAYVQASEDNDITNTMSPRTTGCICLGPTYNAQGAYRFLSLATWKVIVRRSWKELPIPEEVIEVINRRCNGQDHHKKSSTKRARRTNVQVNDDEMNVQDDEVNVTLEDIKEDDIHITLEDEDQEDDQDEDDQQEDNYPVLLTHDATHQEELVFNLSVKSAMQQYGDAAKESIVKEISQIIEKGCLQPIEYSNIPEEHRKSTLNTIVFVKVKKDGRIKTRLVVDGRGQRRQQYEMSSYAPTARTESVFLTTTIEAFKKMKIVTADIEGAFLASEYPYYQVVKLSKEISSIITHQYPEWKQFINHNGCIYCTMKRAIYGNILSPALFHQHLSRSLTEIGFTKNPYDQGVYQRPDGTHIVVHVDDLKIAAEEESIIDQVLEHLIKVYKKLTINRGQTHEYLGMTIKYQDRTASFDMTKTVEEIINEFPVSKSYNTPATKELFEVNSTSPPLNKTQAEEYHSMAAKLLYLSKRARPDILLAVNFLNTRVRAPTEEDNKKLIRVIGYLKGTKDLVLTLEATTINQLHAYIDASHAVHADRKSQTGLVVTLGKGAVFAKSIKQKAVSKSSTVAEIFAVSDSIDDVIWAQNLMKSMGIEMKCPIIHQDNKAAITIAHGRNNDMKTRHVDIRHFYITDLINNHEVQMIHTGTKHMLSDCLTKPLQGAEFINSTSSLLNASLTTGCVEE